MAATTLAMDLAASFGWLFRDALDLSTANDNSSVDYSLSVANGTGSGLADRVWHDKRTLTSAASETLDLNALTNSIFGSTVTINLVKVKGILLVNAATAAGEDLTVGNAATAKFIGPMSSGSNTITVPPNSVLMWLNTVSGWTTSAVNNLKIANAGTLSNTYKIVIFGTSA